MISRFSDQIAYLPNVLQCSRRIYQRGWSSLRSPSSTIQPGWTVLPVSGLSIIPADNNPNWENASANPITNNNIAISFTHSQSKYCQNENTNEQLANVLGQLANTLNFNQTPSSNTNTKRTKAHISNIFSDTESDKLNDFLFQCHLYFRTNLVQFNTDIAKINFTITYFTGIAQDWFEVGLNQEDQSILQDWLSNWNQFVDKLHWHFGFLNPIGKVANMLNNLCIKIFTYNVDFICYAS